MNYEMVLAWVIVSVVALLVLVPAIGYPFVSCDGDASYSEAWLFGCFMIVSLAVLLFVGLVVLWAFLKVTIG